MIKDDYVYRKYENKTERMIKEELSKGKKHPNKKLT